MAQRRKTSITLSDDEVGIIDALAALLGVSRSAMVRHLLLSAGIKGGSFSITRKLMELPVCDQERITAEIRDRAVRGEFQEGLSFTIE